MNEAYKTDTVEIVLEQLKKIILGVHLWVSKISHSNSWIAMLSISFKRGHQNFSLMFNCLLKGTEPLRFEQHSKSAHHTVGKMCHIAKHMPINRRKILIEQMPGFIFH